MEMAHQQESQQTLTRSENSAPEPTTDEIIIRGSDIATEPQQDERTHDEIIQEYFESEKKGLDAWLALTVRKELVPQVYKNPRIDEFDVDVQAVMDALSKEIINQGQRNLQTKNYLQNKVLPYARSPYHYDPNAANWAKDIPRLENRIEVHERLDQHIESLEDYNEDQMYDMSWQYIVRTIAEARQEVMSTYVQQKAEIKAQRDAEIAKLSGIIDMLETELEDTKAQVVERDLALLDQQLSIEELTVQAQELAI